MRAADFIISEREIRCMATKEATKEKQRHKLKEPKYYQVIMLNDDFTPMDFVVQILIEIFHKDPANARRLMMQVHTGGKAVVAKYSYDIAMTKVGAAMDRAKKMGYPFRLTVEEEP